MSRTSALLLSTALRFVSKFSGAVFFILVPYVAASLAATEESIQLLIPLFLCGSSVSQFFVGSLADVYGKRKVLFLLLGSFVAGSVTCAVSEHLLVLQAGVLAISLGVGAIAGVGNTLIFDGYASVQKAGRALSFSSILVIWAPALAMNIGIAVAQFDWHWFFWMQAASGAIMLWMTWRDVPAIPASDLSTLAKFRSSAAGYLELLANAQYRRCAFRMCFAGGGIVVFYSIGLPYLQGRNGVPDTAIGWVPCVIVAANSVGRLVSGVLAVRVSVTQLGRAGAILCLLGGAGLLGAALVAESALFIVAAMAVYGVGIGVMFSPQRAEMMRVSDGKTATSEGLAGILMSLSGAGFAWLSVELASAFADVPLILGVLLLAFGAAAVVNLDSFSRQRPGKQHKKIPMAVCHGS